MYHFEKVYGLDGKREDVACVTKESALLLCNYISTISGIDEEITRTNLGTIGDCRYRLLKSWLTWSEIDEIADLFDLKVKEYESVHY